MSGSDRSLQTSNLNTKKEQARIPNSWAKKKTPSSARPQTSSHLVGEPTKTGPSVRGFTSRAAGTSRAAAPGAIGSPEPVVLGSTTSSHGPRCHWWRQRPPSHLSGVVRPCDLGEGIGIERKLTSGTRNNNNYYYYSSCYCYLLLLLLQLQLR